MFRHPRYLDLPWDIHWRPEAPSHHHWWLILLITGMLLFLIGVGVTSGLF